MQKAKEVEEKLKEQKEEKLMTSNKLKRCSKHFRLITKAIIYKGYSFTHSFAYNRTEMAQYFMRFSVLFIFNGI